MKTLIASLTLFVLALNCTANELRNPPPSPVSLPVPDYPVISRRLGEQGTVLVRILINEEGYVDSVAVERSSGFPRLDMLALEAARQARFRPYLEKGMAIKVMARLPYKFALEEPKTDKPAQSTNLEP